MQGNRPSSGFWPRPSVSYPAPLDVPTGEFPAFANREILKLMGLAVVEAQDRDITR